jgi:hypothetical protein
MTFSLGAITFYLRVIGALSLQIQKDEVNFDNFYVGHKA